MKTNTRRCLSGAMALLAIVAGCAPEEELIESGCSGAKCDDVRGLPNMDAALHRIYAGDDTFGDVSSGRTTALTALVESPERAAVAWRTAYEETPESDARRHAALLFLAGDACLDGLVDTVAEIAERESSAAIDSVNFCQGEAPPPTLLAPFAIRSLGKMTRSDCGELGSDRSNMAAAAVVLANWVTTGERGIEVAAAEQLLAHRPRAAEKLRRQLPYPRALLLESIESRRIDPYVEESAPPEPAKSTLSRFSECDPEDDYSRVCEAPFNFDPREDGDEFIQEAIAFNASFFGQDDCSGLAERYDREIDFEDGTWDEGYGIRDACNPTKPFARAVNALWLLENSAANNAPGDRSGGVIHWAYDYVKKESPEIEGSCSDEAMAISVTGFWCDVALVFCDERIELMANFHKLSAPIRASTILHEVRHVDGYDHNAGEDCPRGGSCDSRYSYRGANTISVQWIAQFVRIGRHSTPFMREDALSYANHVLHRRYRECPGFSLDDSGNVYETGETPCIL